MPSYRYAFISHAHMDNALCDPYSTALARLGVPHYYDRENPQVGHSLSLALQQEIERAGALIVMVSPASVASFWVNEEIDMFFALMAEDRSRKLIPVKIASCDLPPRLKSRWWLDATTLSRDDVVAQLARALEDSGAPAPSIPPLAHSRASWTGATAWATTLPSPPPSPPPALASASSSARASTRAGW
jgi:TIR domain-containing protein